MSYFATTNTGTVASRTSSKYWQFIQKDSVIAKHMRELKLIGSHESVVSLDALRGILKKVQFYAANWTLSGKAVLCEFASRRLEDMLAIVCMSSEVRDLAINGDDWAKVVLNPESFVRNHALMYQAKRVVNHQAAEVEDFVIGV
ncbi:hypothetical protein K466DRAFT_566490 [Polyporus arcularius HHB13444]|uniref:Uncharacterized protein n=1 Tax=Polyporus arcularius HHB13444 TaxID=1314778 RepID=A0A5C3P842_9APHY|nr:hypothetical protein K466DRAFT_566490 [Polyporus arcularius HHB13444]